jgi:hypothetical protein
MVAAGAGQARVRIPSIRMDCCTCTVVFFSFFSHFISSSACNASSSKVVLWP